MTKQELIEGVAKVWHKKMNNIVTMHESILFTAQAVESTIERNGEEWAFKEYQGVIERGAF